MERVAVVGPQPQHHTRVVAVEYPRKGIWQLGFVTGEALMDISAAANEPETGLARHEPACGNDRHGFTIDLPEARFSSKCFWTEVSRRKVPFCAPGKTMPSAWT